MAIVNIVDNPDSQHISKGGAITGQKVRRFPARTSTNILNASRIRDKREPKRIFFVERRRD